MDGITLFAASATLLMAILGFIHEMQQISNIVALIKRLFLDGMIIRRRIFQSEKRCADEGSG
jgi:hypothetical protein